MRKAPILALAVLAAFAPQAMAAVPPDPRVQLLPYESDQVVPLAVAPGYAAVVELAPDEAIQNVVVGNSAVWQVTANSSSDRIIVKPLGDATTTNMIVVTDARRYVFLLEPFGSAARDLQARGGQDPVPDRNARRWSAHHHHLVGKDGPARGFRA